MAAVDCGFHGSLVGFFWTEPRGACIADNSAVAGFDRHHEAVTLAVGMLVEPRPECFGCERCNVESDVRIQDVVVINFRQPGQIGKQGGPSADLSRGRDRNVAHPNFPGAPIQQCAAKNRNTNPEVLVVGQFAIKLTHGGLTPLPGPHSIVRFSTPVRSVCEPRRQSPEVLCDYADLLCECAASRRLCLYDFS